ncbi:MAG: molybdate ABC transporter substrate-binding protein [Pyrinomonadaceae bacterium]
MKFLKVLSLLIFAVSIFSNCNSNSSTNESLTVSAAVSLKDASTEIGELYRTKTGKNINFNFGASGALQRQIETGAPVDVFASAGERQMDELAAKSLIDADSRKDFARNKLVLIVPQNSILNLTNFDELTNLKVQRIAVGNPKTVPAGQYTEQFFERNNLKNALQAKLILAEDVRQVLDYVIRGEVDAGIVYETDARRAEGKVKIAATAFEGDHEPILYPIAVLKDSKQKQSAKEFLDFVLSADGQKILQKYGFSGNVGIFNREMREKR